MKNWNISSNWNSITAMLRVWITNGRIRKGLGRQEKEWRRVT